MAPDLAADARWPSYRGAALQLGFGAVCGLPLLSGEQHVGALNLYCHHPHEWVGEDLRVGQALADMATGYILNARTLSAHRLLADQLQHALDSRVDIEQAKGVLAERHRTTTSEAFSALRRFARSRNLRIHDVARGVIDGTVAIEPSRHPG